MFEMRKIDRKLYRKWPASCRPYVAKNSYAFEVPAEFPTEDCGHDNDQTSVWNVGNFRIMRLQSFLGLAVGQLALNECLTGC